MMQNLSLVLAVLAVVFARASAAEPTNSAPTKNIAAIVTVYTHNSHADLIVSRLLQTDTLDGKGKESPLKLASLYTDQKPEKDISRLLAASHRFRISESIEDALTLGTGRLAVDGVLLIAEHGQDAKFIYDSAHEMKIPLMAGSSGPVTWRRPPADVKRGARLREIVAITYHTTDAYGFHALEFVQALAEQRHGGETGIKAVQSLAGDSVWRAFDERAF